MTNTQKQQKLEELSVRMCEQLKQEPTYALGKSAQRCVPGEGNADADIFFIGEAPGREEDETGRPFVGRSGQLLRKNIRRIGLTETDVFIGNVVKHRPPDNRDPLPSEIEICKPFLDEQINIIEPKIIVTVGRFSMGKFFPTSKISAIHGRVFKVEWEGKQYFVFPMYHPAAALRGTAMMQAFEHDFDKLPKVLEWIKQGGKTKTDEIKEALL